MTYFVVHPYRAIWSIKQLGFSFMFLRYNVRNCLVLDSHQQFTGYVHVTITSTRHMEVTLYNRMRVKNEPIQTMNKIGSFSDYRNQEPSKKRKRIYGNQFQNALEFQQPFENVIIHF